MNTTIRKQETGSTTSEKPLSPRRQANLFPPHRRHFINRELSWLDFNERVLDEGSFAGNPLLERLKFISIFSSNLDEFFMVRIAGLLHLKNENIPLGGPSDPTPQQLLHIIRKRISALTAKQYELLNGEIIPLLEKENIFLKTFAELPKRSQDKMRKLFISGIMPVLTPLAADPVQQFPLLNSGAIGLVFLLQSEKDQRKMYAFTEIPELLDRFISIHKKNSQKKEFIRVEDLIAENAHLLFPGYKMIASQFFRILRDMDYSISDDGAENLIHSLQNKLRQRSKRLPVKIEFSSEKNDRRLQKYLLTSLQLDNDAAYRIPGFLHLKQLSSLIPLTGRTDLTEKKWHPVIPEIFSKYDSVFDAVSNKKNILLAHPYHSFSPIVRLLEEAAEDPDVIAIKQTLYRVSGDSPVVKALLKAAKNGKQVTVLVELKARFDESNNIAWAEKLDHAGAHVVYGIPGLKVHCKTLLIVRKESGSLKQYVHFGTGNYNDKTAESYTDLSILSDDAALGKDAAGLFNLLSGSLEPQKNWKCISIAPFDLRQKITALIKREISFGKKGRIIAKMNSLSDPEIISLIYDAADAGVNIDLIVRGICCCRPGPEQKNLRIISIVDRFLEHSRIFFFGNNGKIELFCSSADWMPRNLNRRIEVMFPVNDEEIQKTIITVLKYHLNDTDKQRKLLHTGKYSRPSGIITGTRSQRKIFEFIKKSR